MQILVTAVLAVIVGFLIGFFFVRDNSVNTPLFGSSGSNINAPDFSENIVIQSLITSKDIDTLEITKILTSLTRFKNTEEKLTALKKLSTLVLTKDFIEDLYSRKTEEKYLHFWRYLVFTEHDLVQVNEIIDKLNKPRMEGLEFTIFLKLQSEYNGIKFDGKSFLKNQGWPENVVDLDMPGKIIAVQDFSNPLPGEKASRVIYEGTFDQYLNYIIFSLNRVLIGKNLKLDIGTGSLTYSK